RPAARVAASGFPARNDPDQWQNAVRNAATSSCGVRSGQSWFAVGARAIGEPSLHGTVLSRWQPLSQLHMQSFGSVVAVRPRPKPIAPIAVLIAAWGAGTLSEIQARSLGRVSPQSRVLTPPPKFEPTSPRTPPNTIMT